jgi:hypothetical protein
MLAIIQGWEEMRVRSAIIFPFLAIALTTMAGTTYAFSLSQLLGGREEQNLDTFKVIHVADLKAMLNQRGDKVHVYDANIAATRQKFGTIPGATLLDSDNKYPLTVLPSNKHAALVFYCANRH